MIDELELLRRHIDAAVDSEPDLEPMRQRLVAAIDREGAIAPPRNRNQTGDQHRTRLTRRSTRSLGGLLVAGVAAAAVVALVITGVPDARHGVPRTTVNPFPAHLSVGDQLRLVADRAAEQPIPHLDPGQALYTQAKLSVVAEVNNGAAQATVGLSVQKWSNASGRTCTSLTAQPARFASPAEQAAWEGLHLLVTPNPSTASQCLQGGSGSAPPDAITGAGQLIDVSSLPTDPTILAQELQAGTTGIPALDHVLSDQAAPNPGFQRAAMLLIGPTLGATAQFDASLYEAIAELPGVTGLGPTATQDGQSGEGFASGPGNGQTTIVVDPSTGQLLEVRGLDDSDSLSSIAENYLDGGPLAVNEYSAQLQWLDPIGSPSVISLSELPASLPVYVFATTRSGPPYHEVMTQVQDAAHPYFKFFKSIQGGPSDPSNPNSPVVFQWSFASPGPVVNQFIQTLRASGLFASVSEI